MEEQDAVIVGKEMWGVALLMRARVYILQRPRIYTLEIELPVQLNRFHSTSIVHLCTLYEVVLEICA